MGGATQPFPYAYVIILTGLELNGDADYPLEFWSQGWRISF